MIIKLEDLLRRRTRLEMVVGRRQLTAAGLRTICEALFGDEAPDRLDEYLDPGGAAETSGERRATHRASA